MRNTIDHIRLEDGDRSLVILDLSLLPGKKEYVKLTGAPEMFRAIQTLQVRGAPAIGIFTGFALYVLARRSDAADAEALCREAERNADYLVSSRPTAVNLSWAARRIVRAARSAAPEGREAVLSKMQEESQAILDEDIAMCTAISEYGLSLLSDGCGVLTHCNAGPIATSRYGTAIGPMILGRERGYQFHVYADETRPLLQGARLTCWELSNAGVDVTLICDNMASMVMKQGKVQFCFVGCDRIAANGDTANKIGTSGVAILANYYKIPFFVLGPSSTVDLATPDGSAIRIELRDGEEIRSKWYKEPMAPECVPCYNPAFDVTDHRLISGIITEKGICRPPYSESLRRLSRE